MEPSFSRQFGTQTENDDVFVVHLQTRSSVATTETSWRKASMELISVIEDGGDGCASQRPMSSEVAPGAACTCHPSVPMQIDQCSSLSSANSEDEACESCCIPTICCGCSRRCRRRIRNLGVGGWSGHRAPLANCSRRYR